MITPRLPAYALDDDEWIIWCDYCRKYHHHSAEEGHRTAVCGTVSVVGNQLPFTSVESTETPATP